MDKDGKAAIKQALDLLKQIDADSGAEFDAQADKFLSALAQKDYAALGYLCAQWGVTEDSLPGYLIARIAEPLRIDLALEPNNDYQRVDIVDSERDVTVKRFHLDTEYDQMMSGDDYEG